MSSRANRGLRLTRIAGSSPLRTIRYSVGFETPRRRQTAWKVSSGSSSVRVKPETEGSVEFMSSSLDTHEAAKSVRSEETLSPREERHHYDDDEAAILPRVLASNEAFQRKCGLVAASPIDQRRSTAEREARAYTPYRGAHRDLIVELLLAGAEPWDDYPERFVGPLRRFRLENLKRRGIWPDDERERDEDPRRRRDRSHRLEEGALRVANHGAGGCIGCGRQLAGDRYERGDSTRRGRRWHCSSECPKAQTEGIRKSQRESMGDAFDAATGQRRAHRAARRKTR
jgi:hypothetical protein